MKKIILTLVAINSLSLNAQILYENFDNFSGLVTNGWTIRNSSEPIGSGSWGTTTHFAPYNGTTGSFAAVNHQSTTSIGTISNWLITPVINLKNGDVISFYSRTDHGIWPDRLELRISLNGVASVIPSSSSTSLGDFTTLALTINPNLIASGYPTVWTNYTYTVSGFSQPTNCRIGFRYYVTNGGANGANSDMIGIDEVSITSTLGIEDFNDDVISFTPNPAQNTLNIQTQETIREAFVYDMLGKKMIVSQLSTNSLDVSNLAKGMYIIKLIDENYRTISSKFIKE